MTRAAPVRFGSFAWVPDSVNCPVPRLC